MASPAAAAAPVLALYRAILRVHRASLPPPIRALADAYTRDEFQRHLRGATTPAQWESFVGEWRRYRDVLSAAEGERRGKGLEGSGDGGAVAALVEGVERSGEMQEEALGVLTPDQKDRLDRLRVEAARVGRSLLGEVTPPQQP
jgi:hypothetical protein